jgi:hypothetical protein
MKIYFLIGLGFVSAVLAQTTAPAGSPQNPVQITSTDRGPDIDPVKFAATKFNGMALDGSFSSFVSGSYAISNVWIYADKDDQAINRSRISFTYPDFYQPTWGEIFDMAARQMRCSWSWNPQNRQFKFERSKTDPAFGVTLADGWRREDRGAYVWHAPKDQDFGMDIYDYGHFTIAKDDAELATKIRTYYAVKSVANWPDAPTEKQMSLVKVGDNDALYLKTDTPRPGGVWRQWSLFVDGNAYLIVSALPKDRENDLVPAIEKMVATFTVTAATTRPAK